VTPAVRRRLGVSLAALTVFCGAVPLGMPAGAQEIVQAVVLDLTVVEVQVIVAGTRGGERLECLLRSGPGPDRVRVAVERPVAGGFASGRTTVVSLPLPLLRPGEQEFRVRLVSDRAVLAQTEWRALFSR
jgi:hypothetical protein